MKRDGVTRGSVSLAVYAVFAYAFLHLPLLILALFSVNKSRFTVWEGLSLDWYRAMFANRDLMESAGNSLLIAVGSTVLATVVGWWDESCPLRFVNAVTTNHADPNAGFTDVVPQFDEDDDEVPAFGAAFSDSADESAIEDQSFAEDEQL